MRRFLQFVSATYAPGMHFGFASLWVLSLLGALVSIDSGADIWVLDLRVLLCILTVFFALFVLRVADEIKDYEYDKVYNPDRPLVTGAVSLSDLVAYIVGTSILLFTINTFLSRILVIIICVDVSYGLFLVWLDKRSDRVRDSMFLNLVVTYPVNVGLSVYTYSFFLDQVGGKGTLAGIIIIIAFAAAFLHWEFCRKTYWSHHAKEGHTALFKRHRGEGVIWDGSRFRSHSDGYDDRTHQALDPFGNLGRVGLAHPVSAPVRTAGPVEILRYKKEGDIQVQGRGDGSLRYVLPGAVLQYTDHTCGRIK